MSSDTKWNIDTLAVLDGILMTAMLLVGLSIGVVSTASAPVWTVSRQA